ncbi:hypothetical protein YC2023_014190 [Brassica napus]
MGWFKRNGQDRRLGKNEMWHEGVVVVSLTNNSHREICDLEYYEGERAHKTKECTVTPTNIA